MLLGSSRPSKSPLESLKNSDQRCFTFSLGRLLKLPFSAKYRKLTRGVRHGGAKSCTVLHKSSWLALSPFGPALPCLGPALASLNGRAWANTTMHGLALPGCTVMQDCAPSCIGQHYHA
ncbi:hypothetical protein E3N88_29543 [Mikania micrantha]|uniref:Uncharacterized protein n=1 Tax=Mikania micrantha TaxID=192012 RepID=A0A5N6MJC4_9ASTR|nr:hypothetical protein E3N88_29543 [Mikania micrantha]